MGRRTTTPDGIHTKCGVFKLDEDGKITNIRCAKSRGHVESEDPRRRVHFDPDGEVLWFDPAEDIHLATVR